MPLSNTMILLTCLIVDSLWAIIIVVLSFINSLIASCTLFSDCESNDEVASSNIKIDGFFKIVLAIDILCLCPPDSSTPLSPTNVWYLSLNSLMNSCA